MNKYLKKYWKINMAASLIIIIGLLLTTVHQFLMIDATEKLIEGDWSGYVTGLLAITLLFAVKLALRIVESLLKGKAVKAMNNQFRADLGTVLWNKNHQQYHGQESGQYLSWFTNDVNQVEQSAWGTWFSMVAAIAQVLFSVIALTYIHWSLLVVSLCMAVVMLFLPKIFDKHMKEAGALCSKRQAEGVAKIKDLLSGYDVLKFFGKTSNFHEGIDENSDYIESEKYRLLRSKAVFGNAISFISIMCQMAILLLIGILSVRGYFSAAVIMGGGNLCSSVYNGITEIAQLRLSLAASKPYFEKVKSVDTINHTIQNNDLHTIKSSVEVQELNFNYGEKRILKDMNLKFEVGKKYAITGPSGCGKSTLLKVLLGWLPDYKGKICIDGKDARKYSTEQLQEQMGYIEQNVYLFNTTIRDNITLGGDFKEEQLQRVLRDSALVDDLASMPNGLETVVGEEGRNLSGGQRQRVAIARALIYNRSILLVDEGTSALDKQNADIVERSLLANPDITLILVSHHLSDERKQQFDQVYNFA